MRQLETVTIGNGKRRHFAAVTNDDPNSRMLHTLCGRVSSKTAMTVVTGDRKSLETMATCESCNAVRRVHDVDTVVPDANDAATRRAVAITNAVEIPARVFRVQGSTDTYTVTIPVDPYLATLCTCMAGKVNPDKQCKHQTAVLNALVESGELIG